MHSTYSSVFSYLYRAVPLLKKLFRVEAFYGEVVSGSAIDQQPMPVGGYSPHCKVLCSYSAIPEMLSNILVLGSLPFLWVLWAFPYCLLLLCSRTMRILLLPGFSCPLRCTLLPSSLSPEMCNAFPKGGYKIT